ncbi:MAG: glutathione peroxidase [Fimbriiglobus sp.]
MKAIFTGLAVAVAAAAGLAAPNEAPKVSSPLDLKVTGLDGKELDLGQFKGKVVLFVNVATNCGYTGQYAGLQALYEKHGKDGLVVVGVPANEFGRQEPGTNDEIAKFCSTKYKVTFPMTAKVVVKGAGQVPLYALFTDGDKKPVGWNFEKFLVNRKGEVVGRFESGVEPDSEKLTAAIQKELAAK